MSVWLTKKNGRRGDALSIERLRERVRKGRLGPRDEIYDPKGGRWVRIGKVRDLRELLPSAKKGPAQMKPETPKRNPQRQTPSAAEILAAKPKESKPSQRQRVTHRTATSQQDVWLAAGVAASCILGLAIFFAVVGDGSKQDPAASPEKPAVSTGESAPEGAVASTR